jgi:5-methyltetrahydrofolate--homocysteine methyltransferase
MPSILLSHIANCVEMGKVDLRSPHPASLGGQNGADEWTKQAIDEGVSPGEILHEGLIAGMAVVGKKFRDGQMFLPEVLMAAKAMTAAMKHLEPHFLSGSIQPRGTIILGTVKGDLHDIGKKIVSLFFQGGGWRVVDLGVDVSTAKFLAAIETHQPSAIGLSALLTTTMLNMEGTIQEVKAHHPSVKIIIGGAPVTAEFARKSGADGYAPDPQGGLEWLAQV